MGSTDSKYEGGIDLKMSVLWRDLIGVHGDKEIFLFLGIDQLYHSLPYEVIEVDLLSTELLYLICTHQRFSILEYDEGAPCPPPISMDHNIVIEFFVGDVYFG